MTAYRGEIWLINLNPSKKSIDNARFIEKLASLSSKELFYIKNLLDEVLI